MDNAIEAHGLVKRFGATTALDRVDLAARTGTVLAVLGPYGAGKTTAVRVLATLLHPDGGRALVGGYDVVDQAHQVRQLIALTGQYGRSRDTSAWRALAAPAGGRVSQTASTSWPLVTTRPGSRASRSSSRRSRAPATSTGRPSPARTSSGPSRAIRTSAGTPPFCPGRRPARPGEGVVGQPGGEQVDVPGAAGDAAGAAGQAGPGVDVAGDTGLGDVAVGRAAAEAELASGVGGRRGWPRRRCRSRRRSGCRAGRPGAAGTPRRPAGR